MRGATLFSGFGGADLGMEAAGIDVVFGVEYDDEIASVARANGLNTLTLDVTTADWQALLAEHGPLDCLHASPVCKSYSTANMNMGERESDREAAAAVLRAVTTFLPRYVTVENVWRYRNSESWAAIRDGLVGMGYALDFWCLDAADYGVPQNRERMIVCAVLGGPKPTMPTPTHRRPTGTAWDLFGESAPMWLTWLEAIADLVPTLESDSLKPWQRERLGAVSGPTLVAQGGFDGNVVTATADEPAFTITANSNQSGLRAVLPERTVRLNMRCLARLQTFPDSYALPDKITLVCEGIGNAVSVLLMQRVYEHLLKF